MKKSWSAPQLSECKSARLTTRTLASPPYTMMHIPSNPLEEMAIYRTTISSIIDCHSMPDSILNKDNVDVVTCMMTPTEPPEQERPVTHNNTQTSTIELERRWLRRRRLRKLVAL